MSKYLYLYRGPAATDFSPERIKAWTDWMERIGGALVDGGAPFGTRSALADDGTSPEAGDLNGYTVVEAGSLEDARSLLDGHPFLTEGKGRYTVEVFELLPM
jgi:hypothetical protein